jgi:hypothetical protein
MAQTCPQPPRFEPGPNLARSRSTPRPTASRSRATCPSASTSAAWTRGWRCGRGAGLTAFDRAQGACSWRWLALVFLRPCCDVPSRNAVSRNPSPPSPPTPHPHPPPLIPTPPQPHLFRMDKSTGAPPDMFDPNGQNWGFPTYNWEAMAEVGIFWGGGGWVGGGLGLGAQPQQPELGLPDLQLGGDGGGGLCGGEGGGGKTIQIAAPACLPASSPLPLPAA